ncbi:phage tail tip fiber protein, partial [Pseudomonas sp. HS6-2]|uniref:phage tail tip fiber protein n=1 Tax=Pseudomonas sp. HS6-2 TaxID=3410986 RepID=UPI003BCEA7AF
NALDAVFDVDWIAVGRVGPSASSRAVSSLDSKVAQQEGTLISQGQALTSLGNRVTDAEGVNSAQASAISQIDTTVQQQGTALTAQAQRLDGIYVQVNPEMEGDSTGLAGATGGLVGVWTVQSAVVENGIATGQRIDTVQSQMGDVSASVQTVSKTVAGVDGKVSAMTTIKAETIAGGRRVMAGLALGSDGQTSEILAYAQRFAIVDESSGQMVLPFVVSNGQVFINQAVINTAFIQQIVAGMTIRSQAVNSQGLPLLELNFVTGAVSIRGQDVNGSTLLNNGGLYVYDAAGIERTAVGRLT